MTIKAIASDPARDDDGILCQLEDGRVFVALGTEISRYWQPGDADALQAFNRAWSHDPALFAGPIKPRVPQAPAYSGPGFIADLTERDRQRMYRIIEKHHRFYFAERPTRAQMDNLIEGIGLRIVEQQVKRRVDAGAID